MELKPITSIVALLAMGACHAQMSLYVSSQSSTRNVQRYNFPAGTFHSIFAANSAPQELVFGSDGNLYGADQSASNIKSWDGQTGAYRGVFATGPHGSHFGLAFGPDGNLYGTGAFESDVMRFNGTTGAFMDLFIPTGLGLSGTRGITFGPEGDLYICNANSRTVKRFQVGTSILVRNYTNGAMSGCDRCKIGPDGRLYVTDETNKVHYFNANTGAYLGLFVAAGSGGLSRGRSLTFGPDANLYVSDEGNNRVLKFDGVTGASLGVFASGQPLGNTGALVFNDNGLRLVNGRVRLLNRDYYAPVISDVELEFRVPGEVAAVATRTAHLDADGFYTVSAPTPVGLWDVSVKYGTWLRRTRGIDTTLNNIADINFDLPNGDVNRDNEVGIGDYAILSTAYGTSVGDPGWDPDADLDDDAEVNIIDYAILSLNYGRVGDP